MKPIKDIVASAMEAIQHQVLEGESSAIVLAKKQTKEKFDRAVDAKKYSPLRIILVQGNIVAVDIGSRAISSVMYAISRYLKMPGVAPLNRFSIFLAGSNALCPDIGVIPLGNPSKLSLDEAKEQKRLNEPWPTLTCDVAEFQSLRQLHERAASYFDAPGSEVQYYWAIKRYMGQNAMVSLVYSRDDLHPKAHSFGLVPPVQEAMDLLQEIGCSSITGVGFNGHACDRAGLAEYEIVFGTPRIWHGSDEAADAPATLPPEVNLDLFKIQQAFFGEVD